MVVVVLISITECFSLTSDMRNESFFLGLQSICVFASFYSIIVILIWSIFFLLLHLLCVVLMCVCLCVKFSLQVFTYRCVCMVCFFLFHSLGVKFVFCWWVRARICVVCVWVVSGISFYLFGIASHELKTINDSDKRWNSKKKTWSELNWRNEKWIYVNKRFLVATATAVVFAVVVGFARTHTTLGLHYDRCEQRICGIIVSQIHFILQSSNGWDTQTNTHTLQIWRFFDSILSIFNTIFHKFATSLVFYALSFLALSLCVVEPLLYFRTMSTITKTSCCDDTTLCIINTTPHKTKEIQTRKQWSETK